MTLGGALSENILCLLAYDDEHCKLVRNSIDLSLYTGPHRVIATRCYDYIDRYNKPPKDHLADILQDKLDNPKESDLYTDIIVNIHDNAPNINREYVLNTLDVFIRRQSLRSVSVDLTKALQKDTEESLNEAEQLIQRVTHQSLTLFDPGTRLGDKQRALAFLDQAADSFPTGIAELDKRGFGPTRKELWVLVANAKRGKSWALIHLAKMAIVHRLKVAHITLEMSEGRCAQRYFQSLFSVAKRKEVHPAIKFKRDTLGRVIGFDDVQLHPKLALDDPDIRDRLEMVIDKWAVRHLNNIFIRQFPTGQLTVRQLVSYLDNLEKTQRFIPDLLIVDYPDLMKTDSDNLRLSLDQIYKDLRGLAVERNIALAIVSQSHRDAARAKTVRMDNVSEAYSKVAHADCMITLSSTDAEHKLGLARLFVAAGRNDQDQIQIVISQQYGTGQFCVDSCVADQGYWDNIGGDDENV